MKIVFEEWPPYQYTKNGKVIGSDVEKVRKVLKKLNIKPEFISCSWSRALKSVSTGEADAIFSLRKTNEREETMIFSTSPLSSQRSVFFVNKKSQLKINSLEDLQGLTVEQAKDNSFSVEFDQATHFKRSYSIGQEMVFKKLVANRSDIAIADENVGSEIIKKLSFQSKVKQLPFVVKENPLFIAFSKKSKLKDEIEKFNEELKKISK